MWFTEFAGNKIGRVLPDGTMTEFPLPNPASAPAQITLGPDGNLWFTEQVGDRIGRITPSGVITEFPLPTAGSAPRGIVSGPDGNLWFTGRSGRRSRRSRRPAPSSSAVPAGTFPEQSPVGQDGNLWFTEFGPDRIGRMSPAGTLLNEFPRGAGSNPDGIVEGPDGQAWFTESGADQIGRIRTSGVAGDFPVPTAGAAPKRIVAGFDANLWFTEPEGDRIARITPSGVVTEFPIPTPDSGPQYIAAGPGGMIWFSEAANKIGVATSGLDTVAPAVTIASPADGVHLLQGASAAADYACDDRADGSGVVGCAGPVARGAALDTSTPGPHAFAVTGTDLAGNVAMVTRTYVVDPPPAPPEAPQPPPGPTAGPGPGLAIASASLRAAYVASELRGALTVAGTADAAARVRVVLRRGAGGRAAATLSFRTDAGVVPPHAAAAGAPAAGPARGQRQRAGARGHGRTGCPRGDDRAPTGRHRRRRHRQHVAPRAGRDVGARHLPPALGALPLRRAPGRGASDHRHVVRARRPPRQGCRAAEPGGHRVLRAQRVPTRQGPLAGRAARPARRSSASSRSASTDRRPAASPIVHQPVTHRSPRSLGCCGRAARVGGARLDVATRTGGEFRAEDHDLDRDSGRRCGAGRRPGQRGRQREERPGDQPEGRRSRLLPGRVQKANADSSVGRIVFLPGLKPIALATPVVYSGAQALEIIGTGGIVDGAGLAASAADAFLANGGGNLSVALLTIRNAPEQGLTYQVPSGSTGTKKVTLTAVQGPRQRRARRPGQRPGLPRGGGRPGRRPRPSCRTRPARPHRSTCASSARTSAATASRPSTATASA